MEYQIQQMEVVVQSKAFPYRTKGDLLRHALHRHLAWLDSLEPNEKSLMGQINLINDVIASEQQMVEFNQSLRRLDAQINTLLATNADGQACKLILQSLSNMEKIPVEYWRDRGEKEIRDRWGHLIKQAPKVNFMEGLKDP